MAEQNTNRVRAEKLREKLSEKLNEIACKIDRGLREAAVLFTSDRYPPDMAHHKKIELQNIEYLSYIIIAVLTIWQLYFLPAVYNNLGIYKNILMIAVGVVIWLTTLVVNSLVAILLSLPTLISFYLYVFNTSDVTSAQYFTALDVLTVVALVLLYLRMISFVLQMTDSKLAIVALISMFAVSAEATWALGSAIPSHHLLPNPWIYYILTASLAVPGALTAVAARRGWKWIERRYRPDPTIIPIVDC